MIELVQEKFVLSDDERIELDEYLTNRFDGVPEHKEYDNSFLILWESIIKFAEKFGAENTINTKICRKRPILFNSPDTIEIKMHDSFAGRIPIIYIRDTSDFEQLVTNLAYKGIRPDNLSQTGAAFISGKTTRLIVLSAKPYSNVPASELGFNSDAEWAEKSMVLRQGHECTHYFTKQIYGITNNILHDEIIADFIGMYEAFGYYRAEWFLRFMGIIKGSGGRFSFYTNGISQNVRSAVMDILTNAAYRLEEWTHTYSFNNMTTADRIKTMCRKGLLGISNL